MQSLTRFFIFCSGVDAATLRDCPTDQNKYFGIGATIFFTGFLAFISASYAIWTVFQVWVTAILFGLIWGMMIFNLDRYIVASMKSRGSFLRDLAVAIPRIMLAALLAVVIAKPLEMKIFESEIEAELVIMEQEVIKEQENKVRDRYVADITAYGTQLAALKAEIQVARDVRDQAAQAALGEADGTTGSQIRNMGPIYRAKKAEADRLQFEFDKISTGNLSAIADVQEQLALTQSYQANDLVQLKKARLSGFAARLDALDRLGAQSYAIWLAEIFIMLLFIAIECAPIFVKLISSRSPYDYLLHQHEHVYEMNHQEHNIMLSNAISNKTKFDTEVSSFRRQKAVLAEKQIIEHVLEQQIEQIKKRPNTWTEVLGGFFAP